MQLIHSFGLVHHLNHPFTVRLRRTFDRPVPPNCGEPLPGRQAVDGETGDVVESFSIGFTKSVKGIGIDTNDRSEVLPTVGSRRTGSKKDASCHLSPTSTFDINSIDLLQRALAEPPLSPVR